MIKLAFWLSFVIILYTYFGYAVLIWIFSRLFPANILKKEYFPSVSIIISVFNEENYIEKRILNLLESNYPKEKLEILIGSDGSTDRTKSIVEKYSDEHLRFFDLEKRQGKVNVLNTLVPEAKGEIIVFTDSRQRFDVNAVKELVFNFSDESVGCVSGELMLEDGEDSSVGNGLGLYWKYEKFIRKAESSYSSMIGATGAIYAIRRTLYSPPPSNTLLDDVFIPMKIVEKGFRTVFDQSAKAFDRISRTPQEESRRKIRTLAGNWQSFFTLRGMLNPFSCNIAFQFISHKLLRVLVPYALLILIISNLICIPIPFYRLTIGVQAIFYLLAILGYILRNNKIKLLNVPYVFCMLNIDAIKGFLAYLKGRQKVTWD